MNAYLRNLQNLENEIFKAKNGSSLELMNGVFKFIEKPYSLRATSHFRSRKIRTTTYGIETPWYLGPNLWKLVSNEDKTIKSLEDFKAKIKTWVPENCLCRLYRTYIPQVGFIYFPHIIILGS